VSRPVFRLFTVAAVAAAAVGLSAVPALAHITVSSPGATQGGFGVLTFRMPNEAENTNAIGLTVQLPAGQPLGSVSVKPQPGWSYTVTRAKLSAPITDDDGNQVSDYPSVVDWKATAGGIKPGEYAEFSLSVGPLPKAGSMVFKALQTYSDGQVVSWIEQPAAGSTEEPEHPAPTLALAPAAAASAAPATAAAAPASDDGASKGSVTGAYVVGGIGLLAGLAALALAATGRKRRTTVDGTREPVSTSTSAGA
jgi:periplasmic copper chaperone A